MGSWYGCDLSADSRGPICHHTRPRLGVAPLEGDLMSIMYWLSGLLGLFLFGYLLFALLKAERF
jgi:K+-transporting ATPase KdpF subunit